MAELSIKFLKAEFCRFEENFKNLKVRIKITDIWNIGEDNIFTAKIITFLGMEYELTDWTETIVETTTKLVKEYDLNLVTFDLGDDCEIDLPLNIGKHTLSVNINDTTATAEFDVVPVTVQSMKNQYLLGVDLESKTELVLQQDLRLITGVEVLEISKETPVGSKELVWDFTNKTLQWDNGEPIVISDDHIEYHLLNMMATPGITDGDYIKVLIEDIDDLPAEDKTEVVIVDVKRYDNEEFQYWINNAYHVLTETLIMTDIEPTLYSSDRDLVAEGYKFLDPVLDLPKNFSETTNYSFEFPVNMLQCIVELWAQYFANDSRININKSIITHSTDGQVVIRLYPYALSNSGGGSNAITFGQAGIYDRSMYAKTHHGARNKTKNFWNGTVVAGILDKNVQSLALTIAGMVGAMDLLIQAGLGTGAGIASRSFSVGGISSSYNSTESAENSRYSGILLDMQKKLGIGKSTKDEQKTGLVQSLKNKVLGNSLGYKY
ncbi:hypothetical protein KAR91_74175 [Candidatus Pacearchaeota archaeon]|nr:hypothetical protein [Candidatus Pacearchaeota archaeon]